MEATRITTQGRAIMDALETLDHPTADQVFAEVRQYMPNIGLATVYRNLDRLVAAGTVRLRDIGGIRRYDVNRETHLHVHDLHTDRLVDVPFTPELREALDAICDEYLADRDECIVEIRGILKEST